MLCESSGYWYHIGVYKNFLSSSFTIFSIGCHKISDIWCFGSKKPEIQGFALKKRFDFM